MKRKKHLLSGLGVTEVGLVKTPANPGARQAILKGQGESGREGRKDDMSNNPIIRVAKAFSMADREAQLNFLKSGEFTRDDCYEALGELAKEEAVRSGISLAKAHHKLGYASDVYKRVYDLSTALPPSNRPL